MCYRKRAAIRFLKYVEPGFLRDLLLAAPKGTVRRMFASVPRKEMERIVSRISEEVLFLELSSALSSFEIRIIFNLRKTG
ncbi:MAG TPA: hypothetical protein DD454_00660 [Candidatus Moranbacteria bacterium]|nr:hypothetical protein [Candidatus Moranbacteria bacterium]